jgi:hypothetical protein
MVHTRDSRGVALLPVKDLHRHHHWIFSVSGWPPWRASETTRHPRVRSEETEEHGTGKTERANSTIVRSTVLILKNLESALQ